MENTNLFQNTQHELTQNKCGYMHPLSKTSRRFIKHAASITLPIVDLGCAYGIATIEAAKSGSPQIIACDMEGKHLQILEDRAVKAGVLSKVTTKLGRFPENIYFQTNSIGSVLASLVLSYLTIEELEIGLKNIFQWLVPDGKLFIIAYSIHIKEFANPRFKAEYQKRVNGKMKWPGYFEDFNQFSTMEESNISENSVPIRLHFFDIKPLVMSLREIGFEIEVAEYLDGKTNGAVQDTWHDGREMLGIVARKPTALIAKPKL